MSEINGIYSFGTIEDINAHHLTYGNTDWPGTDTPKEQQAALRAQRWLNNKNYKGIPVTADQLGPWPRKGVYMNGYLLDETLTPPDLIAAQAEVALLELLTPGVMTPTINDSNIKRKKSITGSEVEYFSSGISTRISTYTMIESYLASYLKAGNEIIRT